MINRLSSRKYPFIIPKIFLAILKPFLCHPESVSSVILNEVKDLSDRHPDTLLSPRKKSLLILEAPPLSS